MFLRQIKNEIEKNVFGWLETSQFTYCKIACTRSVRSIPGLNSDCKSFSNLKTVTAICSAFVDRLAVVKRHMIV